MHRCVFIFAVAVLAAIRGADLHCSIAFECENQDFGVIDGYFFSEAYKSHYGNQSQINASGSVECSGASSCIEANSISSGRYIYCRGSLSCAYTKLYDDTFWIAADAVASMSSSTISVSHSILCPGEQSCSYSRISQFTSLDAGGAYSLLNATIEATNTHDIHLSGYYAAFGATLICNKSQSLCSIYCYANGCINLNLFCGSNQCIITGNNNTFSPLSIHDLWQYDALIMTQQNDDACSLQMDNMTFDDHMEGYALSTTLDNIYGGPICCRGQVSCRLNTFHYISAAANDKSIVCSGDKACWDSNIIVFDGAVYCGAYGGCWRSHITATMVYCLGSIACKSSYINRTSHIYCSASSSCYGSFIKSDGIDLNLHLLGEESGSNAVVKCSHSDHCSIFCGGYKACLGMRLECVGICTVHDCDEYSSCPNVFNLTGNPSTHPSLSPSELPTGQSGSPTKEPSASPTMDTNPPSASPTKGPNAAPTKEASTAPTKGSSEAPSNARVIVTNYTEISDSNDDNDDDDKSESDDDAITIGTIVASMLLIAIASFCVHYFCGKRRDKQKIMKQQQMMQIAMKQNAAALDVVNNNANKDVVNNNENKDISSDSGHDSLYEMNVNVLEEGVRQKPRDSELMYVNNVDAETEGKTQKAGANTETNVGSMYEKMSDAENENNTTIGETNEIKLRKRALFNEWLTNKVKLPQYYNLLVENGFESLDFIKQVTNEEQLKDIGIHKKGHLLMLIKEIKGLQAPKKKKMNNINKKTVTNLTDRVRYNLDLVDDIYADDEKKQKDDDQQQATISTAKHHVTEMHYYDKYHHQIHSDNK